MNPSSCTQTTCAVALFAGPLSAGHHQPGPHEPHRTARRAPGGQPGRLQQPGGGNLYQVQSEREFGSIRKLTRVKRAPGALQRPGNLCDA